MPAKEVSLDVLPRLHLVTDLPTLDAASLARLVEVAGDSADAIQVRAKAATDADLVGWTTGLVEAVRPLGTRVIVDDRLDVALLAGADGVHLGADDLPVAGARRLAGAGLLIGATCRTPEEVRRALGEGADYAGVGPVYETTTKADLPAPLGLEMLGRAAALGPVIAIGGITAARVPSVMSAGAHGVAVVAAVWRASDPPRAAREIGDLVRSA